MKMLFIGVVTACAVPLAAQRPAPRAAGPATIDSGMTQAQVVARLGVPFSARSHDGHTYLFYRNGCEKSCGMSDVVVLDSGKVVDAVFRSKARHYAGASSSPTMITAAQARHGAPTPPLAVPTTPPKKPTS
ncbi:MAG TPA: hypothetical protein VHB25_13800 [Gemmatimonadaceae bacterium]|nr:hypothetical protein [Gemmatimonadaceae bacterium]